MNDLLRIARAARRRRMLRTALSTGGGWLLAASGLAIGLVVADRLVGVPLHDAALIGAPFVAALGRIAIILRRARTADEPAAAEVDRALGFKDRIATGVAFTLAPSDDPFAQLALGDAQDAARRARVRSALPLRADWTWWAWPGALAGAVACAVFIPSLRAETQRRAAETREVALAEQQRTTEAIRDAAHHVQESVRSADDERIQRQLETLDEIARQLESGDESADAARARAAETLQDAADTLDEDADRTDEALADVQERLRELAPSAGETPAGALRDALRSGDLDAARRAADQLQEQMRQASAEEREAIARDLESLADDIPQDPEAQTEPPQPPDEPSAEDELRDQTERLRDAIRDAAEKARKPPQDRPASRDGALPEASPRDQAPPENLPRDDQTQGESSEPSQQQEQQGAGQPSEQSPPAEGGSEPKPAQGEQQNQQGEGAPTEQQSQGAGEQGQPQQGSPQPQGAPGSGPQPPQPTEAQPREQPTEGEQQQGGETGEQPAPRPTPAPGESQPSETPQGEAPASQGEQSPEGQRPTGEPTEQDLQRLREALRRMQDEQRSAEENRQDAQRLREQAERMLEDMSPEERERMERFAEQLAREMGEQSPDASDGAGGADAPLNQEQPPAQGFATEDVNARGDAPPDGGRVISRWFREDGEPGDGAPSVAPETQERLREAADAAERAVEDQEVPNRYRDAIRRYFERIRNLNDPAPAPPPPPAQDAPRKQGGP